MKLRQVPISVVMAIAGMILSQCKEPKRQHSVLDTTNIVKREAVSKSRLSSSPKTEIKPLQATHTSLQGCDDHNMQHCAALLRDNNCTLYNFYVNCTENATDGEITSLLRKLKTLDHNRSIGITVAGNHLITPSFFKPVQENLVSLTIVNNHLLTMQQIASLHLPNLTQLFISKSSSMQLYKGDLDPFPRLQTLLVSHYSLSMIEEGTFDHLTLLKHLWLEAGTNHEPVLKNATGQQLFQVWQFHCACNYAWLRTLFRKHPYLLDASLFSSQSSLVPTMTSSVEKMRAFFAVDCEANNLVGSANQTEFSLNDESCKAKPKNTSVIFNDTATDLLNIFADENSGSLQFSDEEASDGSVDDNLPATGTSIAQDSLSLSLVADDYSLPSFNARTISRAECKSLDTPHCISSSRECFDTNLRVNCSEKATSDEMKTSFYTTGLANIDRSISVYVYSSCKLSRDMFSPVTNIVLSLYLYNISKDFAIKELGSFAFTNLVTLSIQNRKNVQIFNGDLDPLKKLRKLKFRNCSFLLIEPGSFDNLRALKHLSFDYYRVKREFSLMEKSQLYQLHCHCDYAWLRTFLRKRPYLLKERERGEIFLIRGYVSAAIQAKDIFVPVDCAVPNLLAPETQKEFSVNDNCCAATERNGRSIPGLRQYCFIQDNSTLDDPLVAPPTTDYLKSHLATAQYVKGWIVYPILLIVCTIGNVLSVLVLFSEQHKTSTNVYLMVVSVSDLFTMWLQLPSFLYNDYLDITGKNNAVFVSGYKLFSGLLTWGCSTSMQVSNWTLVAFSVERLLAIIKPLRFRHVDSFTCAAITCSILFVLCGLMRVYYLVSYYMFQLPEVSTARQPAWTSRWHFIQIHSEIVIAILDFAALLVLNTIVIAFLYRQRNSAIGQAKNSQEKTARHQRQQSRSCTILLLGSAGLFLVTQLTQVIYACLKSAYPYVRDFPQVAQDLILTYAAMSLFVNYSANCYVYLVISKRFRTQLSDLFRKCCNRLPLRGLSRNYFNASTATETTGV